MHHHRRQTFVLVLLSIAASAVDADYEKGFDAYSEGNYATALAEWQPLAEQGDAKGQFGLGLLYANGWGVDLDDDQAMKWYGLAAEQNHGEAAYNLGVMCANGWGVPQNDEEAFRWYSLAAENGFTTAQTSLGKMYAIGFGAPQDSVKALMWYSVAAMFDDINAEFERDEMARMMSAEDIASAEELAKIWVGNFESARPK